MPYFAYWKLSTRLYAAFFTIIFIAFVVGFTLFKTMSGLGVLQDQGATRFKDSQSISIIIKHFEGFYPIVADSAINMNFTETHKNLADFKVQAEIDIKKLSSIVDTPAEKKNAENFGNNYATNRRKE
jgi:hypothetical protein